jgi:hypothetical protein
MATSRASATDRDGSRRPASVCPLYAGRHAEASTRKMAMISQMEADLTSVALGQCVFRFTVWVRILIVHP